MSYTIKVAQFEGPFDLILFFIERDEVDIYDIPINKLTDEFLAYIRAMEQLNIDLASEFILVAATLMRIKAKTLLPRKELNEAGEEIDPRQELVDKLLEYKKYKEIVEDLRQMSEDRDLQFNRGDVKAETRQIYNSYSSEVEIESINLFKLLKTFNRVLERMENRNNKVQHRVVVYPYTIRDEKLTLVKIVNVNQPLSFEEIFESCHEKMQAIFRFLALLEIIQAQHIQIKIEEGFNKIWINVGERYEFAEEEIAWTIEGRDKTDAEKAEEAEEKRAEKESKENKENEENITKEEEEAAESIIENALEHASQEEQEPDLEDKESRWSQHEEEDGFDTSSDFVKPDKSHRSKKEGEEE